MGWNPLPLPLPLSPQFHIGLASALFQPEMHNKIRTMYAPSRVTEAQLHSVAMCRLCSPANERIQNTRLSIVRL